VQLVISASSVVFILATINAFCAIDVSEISGLFLDEEVELASVPDDTNIYEAAENYLYEAAIYSHNALTVVRYHLEAYTTLSMLNAFICDLSTGRIGWGCLFGYSGDNQQPLGGYGADMAALNIFFNGAITAHFSALNFLFILQFVYKGFAFLFIPLGVFLRAVPYMRSFGGLLIAVAMSFLVVYPFLFSVLYLMRSVLLDANNDFNAMPLSLDTYNEKKFPDQENAGSMIAMSSCGEGFVKCVYFSTGDCTGCFFQESDSKENVVGAIAFASYAFVAAVFMPTVVLIGTIASVSYIARLYGEEIDLSRITQLV
jgi:hypothetical protein